MPRRRAPQRKRRRRTRGRPTRRRTASFNVRFTNSGPAAPDRSDADRPDAPPAPRAKADFVLVLKAPRRLLLLRGDRVLRDYAISLGRSPDGPKRHYLDGRTPEGRYVLDARVEDSRFHRALHISYPNPSDLEFARRA